MKAALKLYLQQDIFCFENNNQSVEKSLTNKFVSKNTTNIFLTLLIHIFIIIII